MSDDAPRPKYDTATGRRILGYDPHTGVPILEQPPKPPGLLDRWAWWNRQSAQAQRLLKVGGGALVVILLIVLLATIGGGGSSTAGGSGSAAGGSVGVHLTGIVRGHVHSADFTLQLNGTDMTAFHKVRFTNIYCGWDGSHVTVHLTVHNDLPTNTVQVNNVTVDVSPAYVISGGGSHGDSANSDQTLTVPAGRHITWWLNAGSPSGIKTGSPIQACGPYLESVSR